MKIGINALFLQTPFNGSAQYLSHLLEALKEVDEKNSYILFGPRLLPGGRDGEAISPPFPYRTRSVPALARRNENIEKVVWEQFTGPIAAQRAGVDLFHVPHFAPPLFPRTPTVVTIHDVIPLRLPAYQEGFKVKAYLRLIARAAHRAPLIITISQHAKQDIMDVLHIKPERIRVIYQAAGEEYKPITDQDMLEQVRERYGLKGRYVFYLGGLDQRKNVPQLVRAFAEVYRQVGDPDLRLFISGNPDKQTGPLFPDPRPVAAELGITDQVIYRFVEDEDKAAVYSGAAVFAFPSLYEGFGLTPLEAMSCGTPVVCSNRTSLPEVVGDAALLVDPENTQEMAEATSRVLTDDELARDLRARSLERASWFSWRKTARETVSAYTEALARNKRR